jgi:hypothetical protein
MWQCIKAFANPGKVFLASHPILGIENAEIEGAGVSA